MAPRASHRIIRAIHEMVRALIFIYLSLGISFSVRAAPNITLSNGQQQLTFESTSGRWLSLIEETSSQPLVDHAETNASLWRIRVASTPGGGEQWLRPSDAKSFHLEQASEHAATLVWEGFELPGASDTRVCVRIELVDDEAASTWHLRLENCADVPLSEIHFPNLESIVQLDHERLAVPNWMGQLAEKPRDMLHSSDGTGRQLHFDYPGHTSMQCLAWYEQDGPGFYLSCDDVRAFRKSFVFAGTEDRGVSAWICHFPEATLEATRGSSFELPYRVVVGTFHGDWFTAAERYRTWATKQSWAQESRLRLGRVAPWVAQTSLWVWNRGRSESVIEPAIAVQSQLKLPVSVFWHWWHGCAYDTGFPDYLPPREGNEAFQAALTTAHQHDIRAIVYMNQRLWGMTTNSWKEENAEKYAVKGLDGRVQPEVYNIFTKAPCASMCLHTPFWQNKYAGLATAAVQRLGVDGIYMDQACSSLACYDPSHGHPLGGGTYWMNGFRALSSEIRRRCADGTRNQVVLAGEGVGESWLPHLDLMLSLQVSRERYAAPDGWEPIPFFQAVYHPYAIQYGNYSSLTLPPYDELWPAEFAPAQPMQLLDRRFSPQFRLEQARSFVWGQQLTLANFRPSLLAERSEEMEFLFHLVRVRRHALKFLQFGTMLRPPIVTTPDSELEISRLSIYAGQRGQLSTYRLRAPQLLAAAYRAPDNRIGIALVNLASTPQALQLRFASPAVHDRRAPSVASHSSEVFCVVDPLPERAECWRIDEAGRHIIGSVLDKGSSVAIDLAAHRGCVIELGPE